MLLLSHSITELGNDISIPKLKNYLISLEHACTCGDA